MILILSTDGDVATDEVINWLVYYKHNFIRINDNDILSKKISIYITKEANSIYWGSCQIEFDKIKTVWFRKFGFFSASNIYSFFYNNTNKTSVSQLQHLIAEYKTIRELLLILLEKKKWLAHHKAVMLNKVDVLLKAMKAGLSVPSTLITNNSKSVSEFINNMPHIITKPLSNGTVFETDKSGYYSAMTSRINRADLQNIESFFFPSLIQTEIEKEYEIRSFFLMDKFYSMAIFSQSNDKTSVDFRNYDSEKPNRFIPYNLPKEIECKLSDLMELLNLNTGSIDLIKTKTGEYVFLEVNPAGQFGMVETPCNYDLHKAIAENLIKLNTDE